MNKSVYNEIPSLPPPEGQSSPRYIGYCLVLLLVMTALLALAAPAGALSPPGRVMAWGYNYSGQCKVAPGNDFVAISGGRYHTVALRADGSLAAWGENWLGQCNVPAGNDFVAVAAGYYHSLAVRSNGAIVAWGYNENGQCNVPAGNDFIAVGAGVEHSLALRKNGSIVVWGGQSTAPAGNDFVAVAAGGFHNLALKDNGTVVCWGRNDEGQCNAPAGNFVAVSGGNIHSFAIRSDGSIAAWGYPDSVGSVPAGNNFVAVVAGWSHNLALRSDGTIAAWGSNGAGQLNVPAGGDFVAIAAGEDFSAAIRRARSWNVTVSVPGGHGSALPASQTVPDGMSVPVAFIHDPGYHVATVTDNGVPVTPSCMYWIGNVNRDHNLGVTFEHDVQTVTGVTPLSGHSGDILSDVAISGTNFSSGMTVNLTGSGFPTITGTNVRVSGEGTSFLCNLSLAGAQPGSRIVVVTNPSGLSVIGPSFFEVLPSDLPVNVTSITPASGRRGRTVAITNLSGSGFLPGAQTVLVKGTRKITGRGIIVVNDTFITCSFRIPATAPTGKWDINVTNPYGLSGVKPQAFKVMA